MSSAILYLAIVAIWAVVLVPRWLRLRSAPARQTSGELFEDTADAEATATASAGLTDAADTELTDVAGTRRAPIEWEDSPPPSYELFDTVADTSSPGNPVAAGRPGEGTSGRAGGMAGRLGVEAADRAGGAAAAEYAEAAAVPASRPASASRPVLTAAERRARVLRTRRRMLLAVVSVAAAASVLAALQLAPFWVAFPPALMLAGFLVLLREAAHSDALRAQHQMSARSDSSAVAGHEEDAPADAPAAGASAASAAAAPRSGEYSEASGRHGAGGGRYGEASAQVIDISQRLGDQLYDQYTDAAERAVGD